MGCDGQNGWKYKENNIIISISVFGLSRRGGLKNLFLCYE